MKIEDSCKCGAKFSVVIDGENYNLSHRKDQASFIHLQWLEKHEDCRKRHFSSGTC
jgi:hypothetical protein